MFFKIVFSVMLFTSLILADDLETIKNELVAIDAELRPAVIKGDFDTQLKYFAKDAIVLPPFHPLIKGKAELKKYMEQDESLKTVVHVFDGTMTNLWICDQKVFEQGNLSLSLSNKYDDKPKAFNASYFTVWEREENGELLIVYYMWNLDHPL